MVDLAKLDELIARVEKATGPDRALDAALCRMFDLPLCVYPDCLPDVLAKLIDRVERGEWDRDPDVAFYTASIDAALGLVERMLPGRWVVIMDMAMSDLIEDALDRRDLGASDENRLADLPRFIILALLRALRESSEKGR